MRTRGDGIEEPIVPHIYQLPSDKAIRSEAW